VRWLRTLGACILGCVAAGAVHAQLALSVTAESDHRFRGISLSDGHPDLRLSVAYDHDSGVYAGAMTSPVRFGPGGNAIELLGYVGYVRRWWPELSAEAGLTTSAFIGDTRYDYSELYVGLAGERWSARAYYSPSYFGYSQRTVYVEFDANAPLATRWRVYAHAGALSALGPIPGDEGRDRTRYDTRIGAGYAATPSIDVQLAWVSATRAGPYMVEYGARRDALVLSVTASF